MDLIALKLRGVRQPSSGQISEVSVNGREVDIEDQGARWCDGVAHGVSATMNFFLLKCRG